MNRDAERYRTAEVDGIEIAYVDLGEGDCVVMLHGGGPGAAGWSNFQRNAEEFAREHRVLIVDLPGFGRSQKLKIPAQRYTFYAGIVAGLLDRLGIAKASLVGNSLGGMVALRFALNMSDRLNKLVLLGPPGWLTLSTTPTEGVHHLLNYYAGEGPTREKLRAFLNCMVADKTLLTDDLIEQRFAASTNPEVIATAPLVNNPQGLGEALWREDISAIAQPVLLVWGRDDRVVPVDGAFGLLKHFTNARLHVFAPCGHWVQWERAPEFNQLVRAFLEE
ncbi:MAG: alpha/beta fold hydrolase [Hyphomonadaceae bacterium]|nr:alpha/beta fold hydrolase [Hyphomonadaceae bacterium]